MESRCSRACGRPGLRCCSRHVAPSVLTEKARVGVAIRGLPCASCENFVYLQANWRAVVASPSCLAAGPGPWVLVSFVLPLECPHRGLGALKWHTAWGATLRATGRCGSTLKELGLRGLTVNRSFSNGGDCALPRVVCASNGRFHSSSAAAGAGPPTPAPPPPRRSVCPPRPPPAPNHHDTVSASPPPWTLI